MKASVFTSREFHRHFGVYLDSGSFYFKIIYTHGYFSKPGLNLVYQLSVCLRCIFLLFY